jgi:RHS repeat-associated protein
VSVPHHFTEDLVSFPRQPLVQARCPHAALLSRLAHTPHAILATPYAPPARRHPAALLLVLSVLAAALTMPAAAQKTKPSPLVKSPSPQICPTSASAGLTPQVTCGTVIPSIAPKGTSVTASVGTNSYNFTVTNVGTGSGTMYASPSCTGAGVSGCTVSAASFSLASGASRTVTMTYTGASSGGTGKVDLHVEDATAVYVDDGYINVTVPPPAPTYTVSVTPKGTAYAMAAGTATYNFLVANNGTGDATYTFSSSCAGTASGCSAPAPLLVPHGTSAPVGVTFSATTPGGTGTVSLTASYGGYSDAGSINVSVNNSYAVSVDPKNQSQVVSPSSSVTFHVTNMGSIQTTFNLSVNCSMCGLSQQSTGTLQPGYSNGMQVPVSLNGYSGTVVLTASDPAHGTSDQGSIIVSPPTYTVGVSPHGGLDQWYEAGQPGSVTFSVSNSGNSQATYSLSGTCDPVVTACSAPPATVTLGSGSSTTEPISFTAGSAGSSGYVRLNASGPSSDAGYFHLVIYDRSVAVTPSGQAVNVEPGTYTQAFTIANNGNTPATYNVAFACSGVATGCSASATSVNVNNGSSAQVNVTYSAQTRAATGTVQLTATATAGSFNGTGSINVRVNDSYAVAVTPHGGIAAPVDGGAAGTVSFGVQNTGTGNATYNFSPVCTGVSGCTVSQTSVNLNGGISTPISVTYSAGVPGTTGRVLLRAVDAARPTVQDSGWVTTGVNSYTVSISPHAGSVSYESGATGSQTFSVFNGGNATAAYTLTPSCTGAVTSCPAPTSLSVGSQQTKPATFSYGVGAAGSTGVLKLSVTAGTGSSATADSGLVNVTVNSHTVAVTPPAAVAVDPGSYTASFGVQNTGNVQTTYNLAATCSGKITGCPTSLGQITVNPSVSTSVGVGYTAVTRGDTGTVTLTASYAGNGAVSGSGAMKVSVKHLYSVATTPDNQDVIAPVGASMTQAFWVKNTGTDTATYTLTPVCFGMTGGTGCTLQKSASLRLAPGAQDFNVVNFTVPNPPGGYQRVVLHADDVTHAVSDTGWINIVQATYTVAVSPDTSPVSVAQPVDAGKPGTQTFSVYNSGNSTASYTISVNCPSAYLANCTWPTSPLSVASQATANVAVSFTATQTAGVGTITLTAAGPNASDQGTAKWQVNTHYVSVTPKGGADTAYAGSGTHVFGVKNNGSVPNSYTLTTPCSGTVSGCKASPASISNLAVFATQQVTVTYTGAGAGGAGIVQLAATNTVDGTVVDTGSVNVAVKPTYTVAVTPHGGTAQTDAWTAASVPFTITNNGTAPAGSYSLAAHCGGTGVHGTCTLDSARVTVANGQSAQVHVSFPAGAPRDTAAVTVVATSLDDATFVDSGSVRVTVTAYAVSVTPDSQPRTPAAYAADAWRFTVTNTGTTTRTFNLQTACAAPAATACAADSAAVTLLPSGAAGVNVTYTAGDPGATGTVRLVATDSAGRSVDGGSLAVSVGTSVASNQVQFKEINPGTTIERSHCLVFSIVPDVADECGALRIVHPLPAVRTLGKARVPTLIYSSDQVKGPTLAVNVILADTTTIPQSVQLTVVRTWPDNHRDALPAQVYPGTDWQASRRRRIAVPNVASGGIGILRYSVEVLLQYLGKSSLAAPVDSSELAFVDRSSSYFGAGWWLAGLEQLYPDTSRGGSVLWVAGDGSTRKYVNQHTMSGTDTVWLAPALDSPDTLLHRADGTYRRQAGNGLFVEFNGFGLHQRTVNRLGYATVFTYDANNHLSGLQLPPWRPGVGGGSTPAHSYAFAYNPTSNLLDTVTAPPVDGNTRKVVLTRNGATAAVDSITELLGNSTYKVAFQRDTNLMYAVRTNRRGVSTSFAYEASSPTVARFRTATGVDTITVQDTFRTAVGIGAAGGSEQLDSVYFRYDGPRPDSVGAVTKKFWLDRYGAPTRIVNALGQETRIARGDPRFPGLATETRGPAPKFFTTWATYDARGNLRTSTQVNPHADGTDATTTYTWDPTWDMVTQIVQPEGEVTNIGYYANGNRRWQEDGRGTMSRVNFQYYASTSYDGTTGAVAGLLSAVALPQTGTLASDSTRVKYDSVGNVDSTWTPRGAWTAATNDAIGRTIATASIIYADSADSAHIARTTTAYDLQDRAVMSVNTGPATNDVQRQVSVQNFYNAEGQLESTWRTQGPDDPISIFGTNYRGLFRLVSAWRYDNLGRKIAEVAPDSTPLIASDNPVDSTSYDRAGNVESVSTRRHSPITGAMYTIRMTYDALNRLKTRTVPAADYCARWEGIPLDDINAGTQPPYPQYPNNPCVVLNQQGMVFFQKSGGYTVASDVANFDYDGMGNMTVADNADARVRRSYYPNGQLRYDSLYTRTVTRDSDTLHVYVLEYLYDRNGRLLTLKHPVQLSGGSPRYQTGMRYDPLTGALSTVINPLSSTFTYGYDERGQVSSITMPAGVTESYGYDQDGDVTRQLTAAGGVSFHDVTMSYDLRGKMLELANRAGAMDTIETRYSGLGQLRYQKQITHVKGDTLATHYVSEELFTNDAFGNRRGVTTNSTTQYQSGAFPGYSTRQQYAAYEYGTGRLLVGQNSPGNNVYYRDTTEYDEAGNILFTTQLRPLPADFSVDRASFYGADGKLRAVDYRWTTNTQKDFEEYRYDALGRRVLVRARRSCSYDVVCNWSYVRRTVWAGSQELYEIQMPDDSVRTTSSGNVLRENDTDSLPHMPLGYYADPNQYYGRVAYTYGLAADQPLGITRLGYADTSGAWKLPFTVVPLWTMRGYADSSYFAETGLTNCAGGRCVAVSYPAAYWMPAFRTGIIPSAFHGSLLVDKADASGQLYRRNRYYDPATGRFTQEDPIGLAGGLNVYGFAGGDPVNFSDPLGLMACPPLCDAISYSVDLFQGMFDRAVVSGSAAGQAIGDATSALGNRASGYVRGGMGVLATEASVGADGLAVRTGPVLGSEVVGAAAGGKLRLMAAPADAVAEFEVSGAVGKIGVLSVSIGATLAVGKSGAVGLTSVSLEVGGGLGRNGKELPINGGVKSPQNTTCIGTGTACSH